MPQKSSAPNFKDVLAAEGVGTRCKESNRSIIKIWLLFLLQNTINTITRRVSMETLTKKTDRQTWNAKIYRNYFQTHSDFVLFMDINRAYIAGLEHRNILTQVDRKCTKGQSASQIDIMIFLDWQIKIIIIAGIYLNLFTAVKALSTITHKCVNVLM